MRQNIKSAFSWHCCKLTPSSCWAH